MTSLSPQAVIAQIDDVLKPYIAIEPRLQRPDHDIADHTVSELLTSMLACIERTTREGSAYRVQARKVQGMHAHILSGMVAPMAGILRAVRDDYKADRLRSVEELIHADVFSDFVEMARHLVSESYKDAAAVIVGSTLEGHLRQLCARHGIATSDSTTGQPLKADRLNGELGKVAYDKNNQKQITAWLGLRNEAAHGHYENYVKEQVALMIDGIADFMRRYPA